MLLSADIKQIKKLGISQDQIEWQLSVFQKGLSFIRLNREATPGDGIRIIDEAEAERLIALYNRQTNLSKIKFVPASGAATRMFKLLFDYLELVKKGKPVWNSSLETFFADIRRFAFYEILQSALLRKKIDLNQLIADRHYEKLIYFLLTDTGLNYGGQPKGLLKFHRYSDKARTAFEEHLTEAALYAASPDKLVRLHFTVSPEHLDGFKKLLNEVQREYEKKYNVNYDVTFSVQKPSTDTMAVDRQNDPFRNDNGSILFRQGGHGALIDNLNDLDADFIFIKNIDNVVPERCILPTIRYKKVLAGKLIEIQQKIFGIMRELDNDAPSDERIKEIAQSLKTDFCYEVSKYSGHESAPLLKKILNRPIRVCGIVKNLGEPGGGPFWAPNTMGDISLQIIESSQVNHSDPSQVEIYSRAAYFNPVDLVCSPRTYQGSKFDLTKYVDRNTCFISYKSKDGKELKALELPGLWNGAMADWLTLFVEVPIETFNPVKTVNDLLRPQHQ